MWRRVAALLAALLAVGLLAGPTGASAPSRAAGPAVGVEPLPVGDGVDVDYQLGGTRSVPDSVGIVVRDRTATPTGRYDVCYVNGFQTQPDERRFWRQRMGLVLQRDGRPVLDEDWGEWLLDIRTSAKRERLARIVGRWTERCARDGFDAVEFDNLDSFSRSRGLLDRSDTRAFARLLVREAHRAGLAAAQKNMAGLDGSRLGFDFAISEECGRYDECDRFMDHYDDRVVVVEYRRKDFRRSCRSWGDALPIVLRDRALRADGRRAFC